MCGTWWCGWWGGVRCEVWGDEKCGDEESGMSVCGVRWGGRVGWGGMWHGIWCVVWCDVEWCGVVSICVSA